MKILPTLWRLSAALVLGMPAAQAAEPSPTLQKTMDRHQAKRLEGVEPRINALVEQLTLEEKVSMVHANTKFTIPAVERLGIHEMWMSDGPHGVRYEISRHSWAPAGWDNDQSTYLPPLTTVAATWNRDMAAAHGNVLGAEARHRGKDFILGPGVNLARLPLYGRNFEYMGEDPFLAAELAVSEIDAIQSNDVAATIKHYALNTQELNRNGVNAKPDERTLREVYLPAFEAAVKEAGVWAIMGAYNEFRGTNANQSKHLVHDILKDEWGYQGVVLTDWGVDINTYDAAMNGLDIEMGTDVDSYDDYFFGDPLLEMIQSGKIPESILDDKVRRILRVQFAIGMQGKYRLSGERNTEAHQQAARTIAEEGVVLLKNNGLLPLDKNKLDHILVMGPNANKEHALGGGSSEVPALFEVTPLEGLKKKLGDKVDITFMRTRPEGQLLPIATDYVTTRHWTGTPTWYLTRYDSAERKNTTGREPVAKPAFSNDSQTMQHLTVAANVQPVTAGDYHFVAQADGELRVTVNGEPVLEGNGKLKSDAIELAASEPYELSIEYDGRGDFTLGWETPDSLFSSEEDYLAAAREADAILYFGGLDHGFDREAFDRKDMKLPYYQDGIIRKLLAANNNTAVVMVAGSAVEMPWVDQANALIWGWYGGMHAGDVYADILFGDVNPSGKLPITLPKKLADTAPIMLDDYKADVSNYDEGVFIGYRWFERQNIEPLFPFGYGLSYTTFEYSDLTLSSDTIGEGETLTVTATVTNTGERAGAEAVQLYLGDAKASVRRPAKELKGFDKVHLQPGQSKTVSMTLNQRDLSFWSMEDGDWKAESGRFHVMLGASVQDIRLRDQFDYER